MNGNRDRTGNKYRSAADLMGIRGSWRLHALVKGAAASPLHSLVAGGEGHPEVPNILNF